jgi:hypothetical protein
MPHKELPPPGDHVLRYAGANRLHRDDGDRLVGLLADAFRLREGEPYLSVTWVEYFQGDAQRQIEQAVQAFRRSMKVGTNSAFGMAEVSTVSRICHEHTGSRVRILHEPEANNPAHAGVHHSPRDHQELMECLANEAVCQVIANRDVPEATTPIPAARHV